MTVERTDPPTLAPPVHDVYSHVAVGRGSAVVGHRLELVDPIFAAGRRVFGDGWPRTASTLLGVEALGNPDWLIEIDGLAVVPSPTE